MPLMVFAHLLSSLSIAASGTFLMRLESRTTQGDWLRARFTFRSMALSESDLGDFISQVSPSMRMSATRSPCLPGRSTNTMS